MIEAHVAAIVSQELVQVIAASPRASLVLPLSVASLFVSLVASVVVPSGSVRVTPKMDGAKVEDNHVEGRLGKGGGEHRLRAVNGPIEVR